jgi:hypothetical protein
MSILSEIQKNLKAPKGQTNSFGGYRYRSCEDILEAVKPLLGDSSITLTDDVVEVGKRVYVKATATLNWDNGSVAVSAYAREAESKKGMDAAQITGSASSYARKYALNGLFAIDDTKDSDTTNRCDDSENQEINKAKQEARDLYTKLEKIDKGAADAIMNEAKNGRPLSECIAMFNAAIQKKGDK